MNTNESKEPVISVRNVTVRYGDNTILENVSCDIYRGEIFVIVGGSGCGKSTLLRQIIGLENPTSGEVFVEGENLTQSEGEERRKILKKFGILFQSSGLFASMTIAENIALSLSAYTDLSNSTINRLIDLKLRSVGLEGYENYIPSELSGGMKKRAALARAMALDPGILCFDEPSSGLDPVTSASLDNLIKELNTNLGTTMVVVTHDLSSIMEISQRIILLDKAAKGIIAEGTPEELRNYQKDRRVYNFFNRIA